MTLLQLIRRAGLKSLTLFSKRPEKGGKFLGLSFELRTVVNLMGEKQWKRRMIKVELVFLLVCQ